MSENTEIPENKTMTDLVDGLEKDVAAQFGKTMMPWNQRMPPQEDEKGQEAQARIGKGSPAATDAFIKTAMPGKLVSALAPVKNHVDRLEQALAGRRFSPAFSARLAVLRHALAGGNTLAMVRPPAAPFYCNDPSVRHFLDARDFYLAHVRLAGISPLPSKTLAQALEESDLPHLASLVDAFLLFFGDYPPLAAALAGRTEEITASGSLELVTIAASVLAENSDRRALPFFDALERRSPEPVARYLAAHRRTAFLSKRLHEPKQALKAINAASDAYLKPLVQAADNDGDRPFVPLALFYNLRALPFIMLKDVTHTQSDMADALSNGLKALSLLAPGTPGFLQVARFSSQIVINLAQMAVEGTAPEGHDSAKAVSLLSNQSAFIARNAADFSCEAFAELAIALYHDGRYEACVSQSLQALTSLREAGFLTGIRSVRRVLAASLVKLGRQDAARTVLDALKNDPLALSAAVLGSKVS